MQQKYELDNTDNSVLCPPKNQNKQYKNKLQIISSGPYLQKKSLFPTVVTSHTTLHANVVTTADVLN